MPAANSPQDRPHNAGFFTPAEPETTQNRQSRPYGRFFCAINPAKPCRLSIAHD
nr:MAG TPA: hypothetical protein [Caudoviricetes sp.]